MKRLIFLLMLCVGIFTASVAQTNNDDVVVMAEQMPEFDGDLMNYIAKNIQYPPKARENGIQGRVIAQFIVRKDGSLDSIQIISSPDVSLSNEVVRMISAMPNWKPGKQNGKPISVKCTLPVAFKLDDSNSTKKKK
jgi:periplasmic protein TonB